jgi:hypothetical protein
MRSLLSATVGRYGDAVAASCAFGGEIATLREFAES